MANDQQGGGMISLGGLWINKSKKDGSTYLSGRLGFARILVFKNKRKNKDSDPDYTMCIAASEKRDGGKRRRDDEGDFDGE